MCGRFAFFSPREAVQDVFGVSFPAPLEPRYNIAPTQFVAVLRANTGAVLAPALLQWGLVPSWAKDPAIGNRMINARAETVHEKPSYRAAFRRRRCVVLADGFYEWRREGDRKTPYYITISGRQPFAMAGLWEYWQGADGTELETCTIVTTAASASLAPLHARMPVVLDPGAARHWCDTGDVDAQSARRMLAAANADFDYWPVSTAVNNARHDHPELIEAVG